MCNSAFVSKHPRASLQAVNTPHASGLPCVSLPIAGVQFATNQISEGLRAAEAAAEAGADWVDLNCGCPIYEATRRGLGAALLRKPAKLAKLVSSGGAGERGIGNLMAVLCWRQYCSMQNAHMCVDSSSQTPAT